MYLLIPSLEVRLPCVHYINSPLALAKAPLNQQFALSTAGMQTINIPQFHPIHEIGSFTIYTAGYSTASLPVDEGTQAKSFTRSKTDTHIGGGGVLVE